MVASGKKFSLWKILLLVILSSIILFIATFNLNTYRDTVLAKVNEASPVTVKFDGIHYRLTSPGHFELENLHIHNDDNSLDVTLNTLMLNFDVAALWSDQVIVNSLKLGDAKVNVTKAALDALSPANSEKPADDKESAPLPVKHVAMNEFSLNSLQLNTDIPGKEVAIQKLSVKVFDGIFVQNSAFSLGKLQLTSNVNVEGIQFDKHDLGVVKADFHLNDGQLTLTQLLADSQFAQADAQATVNLLDPVMPTNVRIQSSQVHLAPIFDALGKQSISATGDISLSGKVDVSPLQPTEQLITNTAATLALESTKLTIEGIDLDNAIGSLQDSQNAGLMDIGGFMLTGPIGLVAGQMLDLGSGAIGTGGGTTLITGLGVHTTLNNGVVDITDTAIATSKHRVSFAGGFDIPNLAFNDLTFNILDEKGCATLQQTLKGSINNPQSAVTDTLLGSLVNPLLNFAKKAGNIVDDSCKPVYKGQVKHPVR